MNDQQLHLRADVKSAQKQRRPRAWLRLTVVILGAAVLGSGVVAFQHLKTHIIQHIVTTIQSKPPTVATATAVRTPWQPAITAPGSLVASNGAEISAEVSGIVGEIDFTSGEDVPAGTVLLRLRPDADAAQLAELQATASLDEINYQRDLKQLRVQGVAQATVDSDLATLKNMRAQVAAQQATMDEKVVRAPFAGRLGVRLVNVGQYLSAGTSIVPLQALDPMYADFYVPQQALAEIRPGQGVTVHADAYPGRSFKGTILALDSTVDSSSRMIKVRATLANADHALLPGMYVTVEVAAGTPQMQVTLPQSAVAFNPYGSTIFKLVQSGTGPDGKPKLTVQQQFVTTGATRGDQVVILKGVSPGDVVVSAGQLKLQNGMAVAVNNSVLPTDDAAPAPTAEQ